MDVRNQLNRETQTLCRLSRQITQWENSSASIPNDDLRTVTQLANSISNIQNLGVIQLSPQQRMRVYEALKGLHGGLSENKTIHRRMQAAHEISNPRLQQRIENLDGCVTDLMQALATNAGPHIEATSDRQARLAFARVQLTSLLDARAMVKLKTPVARTAWRTWSTRVQALLTEFPELRQEIVLTRNLIHHHREVFRELLALGAPITEPYLLSAACETHDLTLIDALLTRYEQEPSKLAEAFQYLDVRGHRARDVFTKALAAGESRQDPRHALAILTRLIQAYKHGKFPPYRQPSLVGKLCRLVIAGKEAYGPVILELMDILHPESMRVNNQEEGTVICDQYTIKITQYLSQEHWKQALIWFKRWQAWPQSRLTSEAIEEAREMLRDCLLPRFEDPVQCGPLLDSLEEQMPVLFRLSNRFGEGLEKDGSPCSIWLQANDWWRDRDPNWLSTEMFRELDRGVTHLHRAMETGHKLVLALPDDILRTGMGRQETRDGVTPLMVLVGMSRDGTLEPAKGVGTFDRILARLGPTLESTLKKTNKQGLHIVHQLFDLDPPYRDSMDSAIFIQCLAKYPQCLRSLLLSPDSLGRLPVQMAVQELNPTRRATNRRTMTTLLEVLDIPATAEEALASTEDFIPWLHHKLRVSPLPVNVLLLPFLRNNLQELTEVIAGDSKMVSHWFTDKKVITSLLQLPSEIWQLLLTTRNKPLISPLEYLTDLDDTLFLRMLYEHDEMMPFMLLREPQKYGWPHVFAAGKERYSFLKTLFVEMYGSEPWIQKRLLALEHPRHGSLRFLAEHLQKAPLHSFLDKIELPLLKRQYEQLCHALGSKPELSTSYPVTPTSKRLDQLQTQIQITLLQRKYLDRLPELEKQLTERRPIDFVEPSLQSIKDGDVVPNYFEGFLKDAAMKQAPTDVDFAAIILAQVEQLPIAEHEEFYEYEGVLEGERRLSAYFYTDVKAKLVTLIQDLASGKPVTDNFGQSLPPALQAQMVNVLRHLALYIQNAQQAIHESSPAKGKELLRQLNQSLRKELIADFGVGLFHCIDANATHTFQLYDYIMGTEDVSLGSQSLQQQLQNALHQYRKMHFEFVVTRAATGNTHDASTRRYYYDRLAKRAGVQMHMEEVGGVYQASAVPGRDEWIMEQFDREQTPMKLVDHICGLLNNDKDKTVSKQLVRDWFYERYQPLHMRQIMDDQGRWSGEAIGLLLTAMGIIKLKQ